MRKRIGKYFRQAEEKSKSCERLIEREGEKGRGEKREERVGCDEFFLSDPCFPFRKILKPFLSFEFCRGSLWQGLYTLFYVTSKVFINISQFSSASPPLKRLLPGSEDYRPSQFFCLLCKPSQGGGEKMYMYPKSPTHLTRFLEQPWSKKQNI